MNADTLKKMVGFISTWRKEMNNPSVPLNPNAGQLQKALSALDSSGVPEGLAAYLVLVCEYLFRLKSVDEKDADELLMEIETNLNRIMGERPVYHVVKALEPAIRESILEEGRKPIPFKTNLRPALVELNVKQRGAYPFPSEPTPMKRIALSELAPKKSGPMPWIAPWVAGSAIKRLLAGNGAKESALAFGLVLALHDESRVEEGDFRKRDKALQGPALEKFIPWYSNRFNLDLKNETLMTGMRKPLTWEEFIFLEWEPEKQVSGFAPAGFVHNPDLVYGLLKSYTTTGKTQKTSKRGKA